MEYKRSEVLKHRQLWIDYLKQPETKKAINILESPGDNEARCCLGHACYVLGVERNVRDGGFIVYGTIYQQETVAPVEIEEKLGLKDNIGSFGNTIYINTIPIYSLTCMNDRTEMTPQEIGEYLESVIEGGDDTPFIPLSAYEDN